MEPSTYHRPVLLTQTLEALDRAFIQKNLSPGGTADLLALTFLLHFLKEEPYE